MRWLIATLAVAVVAAGPAVIYWRLFRADERAQPEWSTEWKRTDRATKRRVRRALRRVETLYNPDDARLLVGLSRRMDRFQFGGRWWRRVELPLLGVVVVLGLAAGSLRAILPPIIMLGSGLLLRAVVLPRQQRRRQQTIAANQRLHGRQT